MKLITLNVTDEEHKDIKLKATQAGLSIKEYLLGRESTYSRGLPKKTEPLQEQVKRAQSKRENMKFCPNGHPIPEGSSKCLGKGCKYS